jgi:hypothetical protein
MAVDTTDDISHAAIGALGLLATMVPAPSARPDRRGHHEPPGAYGHRQPSGI